MKNLGFDISKSEQYISDTQRKQRVLSVEIQFQKCKQYTIVQKE